MGIRPVIANRIKHFLISTNSIAVLRAFYRFLYQIQLRIMILSFASQKGICALILRRGQVMSDGYPGNSDFDITCLVACEDEHLESAVSGVAQRYKFFKKLLFPIGETKLISLEDFPRHMRYGSVNYYDAPGSLCFLYKKKGLSLTEPTEIGETICFHQGIFQTFFTHIAIQLYTLGENSNRLGRVFSRDLCKNVLKIDFLINRLNKKNVCQPLTYESLPQKKVNFMLSADEREGLVRECEKLIKDQLKTLELPDDFTFQIQGSETILENQVACRLQADIGQSLQPVSHLLDGVFLFNYRLYKSSKAVLFKYKNTLSREEIKQLGRALDKIAPSFKALRTELLDVRPLTMSSDLWERYAAADKIARLLFQHNRRELLRNETISDRRGSYSLNVNYIMTDLMESIDLIHSYTRSADSLYLLDLLFGHLILYNSLLERKILYGSFDGLKQAVLPRHALTDAQREIIAWYQEENYEPLARINALRAWKLFKDTIIGEIHLSRGLIKNADFRRRSRL